jgi:hypothetical protein
VIVLNELTGGGMRRLELWPDDVSAVSSTHRSEGAEVMTIDGKRFAVAETVMEVFDKLEESDEQWDEVA